MDTTEYPSLPSLTRIHARLAADTRRVEQLIDKQLDVIERLFHATMAEDWLGVASATRVLANLNPAEVSPEVIAEARKLYQELIHDATGLKHPKHLSGLLEACRDVRKRSQSI
jgi:hypothetical protein